MRGPQSEVGDYGQTAGPCPGPRAASIAPEPKAPREPGTPFALASHFHQRSPRMQTPTPSFAAIDLGSNKFRLEIGHLEQGAYRHLLSRSEPVGLGRGFDPRMGIAPEALDRGLQCLAAFARDLARVAPRQVRVVATQTLREAPNRREFIDLAMAILGQPVEVISGNEEARLIYAGVALLRPTGQRRLVLDIGGRSTELIVGNGAAPTSIASLAIGCASITARHFGDGHLTAARFRDARREIEASLAALDGRFGAGHWDEAVGTSGTVAGLAGLLGARGIGDGAIARAGLVWLIERCVQAGHMGRLQLAGLSPEHRELLPGLLAILHAAMVRAGIARLAPTPGAMRHGVIAELQQRRASAPAAPPLDTEASVFEPA